MKSLWGPISSLIIIILFGWTVIEFYQFANVIALQGIEPPWTATLNVFPFLLLILFSVVTLFIYKKQKKSTWLPAELEEKDEREKMITAKATRVSYISSFYTFPLIAILMLAYPFFQESMSYYPILVILLIPIFQIIVYAFTWQRGFRA